MSITVRIIADSSQSGGGGWGGSVLQSNKHGSYSKKQGVKRGGGRK